MEYGQSYAMAASTIGTDSNLEQSVENGRTSAHFPVLPKIVACFPTTTMLAWESNWVVDLSSSSCPILAVVAQTADNLKAAVAGETYEYTEMYPGFAATAREEGFDEVAEWFETLARAEKSHAGKFQETLDSL